MYLDSRMYSIYSKWFRGVHYGEEQFAAKPEPWGPTRSSPGIHEKSKTQMCRVDVDMMKRHGSQLQINMSRSLLVGSCFDTPS